MAPSYTAQWEDGIPQEPSTSSDRLGVSGQRQPAEPSLHLDRQEYGGYLEHSERAG